MLERIARIVIIGVVVAGGSVLRADTQNDAIGFSKNHIFDGAIGGENINVLSGNITLTIPLGQRYKVNEHFSYGITLYYNSKIWEHDCRDGGSPGGGCEGTLIRPDDYGLGFNLGFGRIYQDPRDFGHVFRYQEANGAEHFVGCTSGTTCQDRTVDGTAMIVIRTGTDDWQVLPGDGTRIKFTHRVTGGIDDDGWYATRVESVATPSQGIDIVYETSPSNTPRILTVTDTTGRQIVFTYSGGAVYIDFPAFGSTTPATYTLFKYWTAVNDPTPSGTPQTRYLLQWIDYPELDSAERYTFAYNSTGSLLSRTIPTGATVDYSYRYYQTNQYRPKHMELVYKELTSEGQSHRWSYTRSGDGLIRSPGDFDPGIAFDYTASNPDKVQVLDPFDNLTVYHFYNTKFTATDPRCDAGVCNNNWYDGLLYKTEVFAGSSELVQRTDTVWTRETDTAGNTIMFQFRDFIGSAGVTTPYSIAVNARPSETSATMIGGLTHGGGTHKTVFSDWTATIPRARMAEEYLDGVLYRKTYTDFAPTNEFHGHHSYVETQDPGGTVLTRTDKRFVNGRLECSVRRNGNPGVAALAGCDEPSLSMGAGDVATVHSFDANGNRSWTEVKGGDDGVTHTTNFTFSAGGYLIRRSEPTIGWDSVDRDIDANTGLASTSRTPAGTAILYDWDKLGRLTKITPSAPEKETTITYQTVLEARVKQLMAFDFIEYAYHYNDLGRLIKEERRQIDSTYALRETEYDIAGRTTRQSEWAAAGTAPSALEWTTFDYAMYTDPLTGVVHPDPLGRVREVLAPDSARTTTDYDGLKTVVTAHDVRTWDDTVGAEVLVDSTTTYTNDLLGRLVSVDSPGDGADADYDYDRLDQLTKVRLTDPNATQNVQERTFVYNALTQLTRATNPENNSTDYFAYDARGRLLEYQDANLNYFKNTYDAVGRLIKREARTGSPESYSWLKLVENFYDESPGFGASKGKLTTQDSYEVLNGISQRVVRHQYIYGEIGNNGTDCSDPDAFKGYTGLNGRLATLRTHIDAWGTDVDTNFCQNELGLPYLSVYPDEGLGRTLSKVGAEYYNGVFFELHDLGRDLEYLNNVVYSAAGAVTEVLRGNGIRNEFTLDERHRPDRIKIIVPYQSGRPPLSTMIGCDGATGASHIGYCPSGGGGGGGEFTLWDSGNYAYDGAGNITGIGVNQYFYDELNRLTDASVLGHNATTYTMGYEYDAFGNMDLRKKTPSTTGITAVTDHVLETSHNNRLDKVIVDGVENIVTYDPNGNMLANGGQGYAWDERNRLIQVSDSSSGVIADYDYDANGYRVRVETEDTETFYIRDRGGQILSEFKRAAGSSDPPVWDRDYIYALGKAMHLIKNEVPAVPKKPWVTIDPQDPTNVTVHWEAVQEPDITHHTVQKSWSLPSGGFNTAQLDIPLPATSYQDSVTSEIVKYQIRSRDQANNYSAYSPELVVRPTGSGPPQPTGLGITPSDQSLRLTWNPITTAQDDDIWGYYIEREIPPLGSQSWEPLNPVGSPVSAAEYIDAGLDNGTTYRYRVKAVDTASRVSALSSEVDGTPVDNVGPAFPLNVVAQPGRQTGQVKVFWDPVSDPDLAGYEVWRSVLQGENGTHANPGALVAANVSEYTDNGATEGATYYYSVRAIDDAAIPNPSLYSAQSSTRPRHSLVSVPQLTSVAFEVDEGTNPTPPLGPPNCDRTPDEENDDKIRVRVQWDETEVAQQYRIYRADGTGAEFEQVGSVAPNSSGSTNEFFDYDPPGFDFTYYVVATEMIGATEEESAASTLATGATERAIDDFIPSQAKVRAIVVKDGRERFSTQNKESRSTQIRWSRVLESQLQGYHVYRYCNYGSCPADGSSSRSPATFKCEPAWIRLTQAPIADSVREFVDDTVGGMLGCFRYAVRPVSLDGTEGHVHHSVQADLIVNAPPNIYEFCEGDYGDLRYKEPPVTGTRVVVAATDMNPIVRGTADPIGAPQTPTGFISELRVKDEQLPPMYINYFKLNWTANQEADLAGYHVEMAGGADGPWERLTTDPVAWWETEYLAQIGAHRPSVGNSRDVEPCSHFRLVAIDESGNESLPTAPATHDPFLSCGVGPTPDAPANLVASTESGASPCNTRLNWDPVDGTDEYIVYRFAMLNTNHAYYQTEVVAAPTTTFLETGDGTFTPPTCPYSDVHAVGDCAPTIFSAFYVTARKTSYGTCSVATTQACDVDADCPGSETCIDNACPDCGQSPKSNVVFWDCDQVPGFARWMPLEGHGEFGFAIASAVVAPDGWAPTGDTRVSLRDDVGQLGVTQVADRSVVIAATLTKSSNRSTQLETAVAPFATLGSTDPPWQLLDLHHDHLGSTRLVTGDNGAESSRHDFLPFGEEIAPVAGLGTKMFTGHEREAAANLAYMLARYYTSSLGRFLGVDPGVDVMPSRPQTWNLYAYVRNQPTQAVDRTGEAYGYFRREIDWFNNTGEPVDPDQTLAHTIALIYDESRKSRQHPNGVVKSTTNWNATDDPRWTVDDPVDMDTAQEALDQGRVKKRGDDDAAAQDVFEAGAAGELGLSEHVWLPFWHCGMEIEFLMWRIHFRSKERVKEEKKERSRRGEPVDKEYVDPYDWVTPDIWQRPI